MGGVRDGYSNFAFLEALAPQNYDGSAALNGAAIDKQGYETLTFVMGAGENVSDGGGGGTAGSALMSVNSCAWVRMQHGNSNAAGAVVWSAIQASEVLLDIMLSQTVNVSDYVSASLGIICASNAGSGLAAGTVWCIGGVSADKQSVWESRAYAVGYIGHGHRWVRLVVSCSNVGDVSQVALAAYAILGKEADWPVSYIRKDVVTALKPL